MRKLYKQFYKAPRRHIQVWEAANGPIPKGYYVDHIDGNPLNDDINNLRLALPKENSRNSKTYSTNKSGLKGLSWRKDRETWRGTVMADGKQYSFTSKDLLEVASWIYRTRRELHGQFARFR
ncbi:homing endonuclease [Escherichia phage vB_Ec_Tarrare]|uniref:Homing endonuclease n=1 Tax=Escherichia phage vB_Ec_Tarrare TaxID=3032379 RepID=A0AAF0D4E5_9CAUD|nr:homing endonuclease [Escherichia phage vB_Ec_Tarrare]